MSGDLFELDIEPDPAATAAAVALEIEPDDIDEAMPTIAPAAEPIDPILPIPVLAPVALAAPLIDVLGADIPLPTLIRFVPDVALKAAADEATAYALTLDVTGPDGLARADVALSTLRGRQTAITAHFADPADIANRVHKRITSLRSDWLEPGDVAAKTVGQRVWKERQRLEAIAAEERRLAQAEADKQARERARQEAEQAKQAQAPAAVVQEMESRAARATAPPVPAPVSTAAMRDTVVTTTWKARLKGTPGDEAPNPETTDLTPAQVAQVHELLRGILDGRDPIRAVQLDWSYLNSRAKADKGTLAISGIEAYQEGGVRAKGRRT